MKAAFIGSRIITDEVASRTIGLFDIISNPKFFYPLGGKMSIYFTNEFTVDEVLIEEYKKRKNSIRVDSIENLSSRYDHVKSDYTDLVKSIIPKHYRKLSAKNRYQFAEIAAMILQEGAHLVIAIRNPVNGAGRGLFALKLASMYRIPHIDISDEATGKTIAEIKDKLQKQPTEEAIIKPKISDGYKAIAQELTGWAYTINNALTANAAITITTNTATVVQSGTYTTTTSTF